MPEARFDLVILHHTSEKTVESLVQELLQLLNKTGDPYLEYKLSEALLFEQSSSAILDDIDETRGKHIQAQFRQLSVETELRPTLQLVAKDEAVSDDDLKQYICPSCNHSQPKQSNENMMDTCNKCGVVGEKLKRNQKKEEIYQAEKHRLEQAQTKKMNEAVERAHHEEEESLRKEARERLGIKNKNRTANIAVGVAVVGAMGVASFFIADTLRNRGDAEALEETTAVENTTDSETDKEKKPLVTIQAGSGSIVVNNAQAPGTGGAKGTTGEAAGSSNTSNVLSDSSNGSFDTVSMSNQQHAQGNGQISTETDTGTDTTTPANPVIQLAAIDAHNAQHSDTDSAANSAEQRAITEQLLANVSTTPDELEILKDILQANTTIPKPFLSKLDTAQFQEHKERLERLLTLKKPGLALVFAEGIDDPYPASLLVLEVAKYEANRQSIELYDDILLTMKGLATMGDSVQSDAMLKASLSQAYSFTGDKVAALALLEESTRQLNHEEVSSEQRCQALAQIETDQRQFGNQSGAEFAYEALKQYAENLPPEKYIHANRAYTHLAAASFAEKKPDDASNWLHKIPVPDARQFLLAQFETLKKK